MVKLMLITHANFDQSTENHYINVPEEIEILYHTKARFNSFILNFSVIVHWLGKLSAKTLIITNKCISLISYFLIHYHR